MPVTFQKPSLSIAQQIDLLEQRGMAVGELNQARHALSHISYYRLRAYWHYFEASPDDETHQFKVGTSLEAVLALYDYDRRLRLLVLDAIERIEVAARGSWAHHVASVYGAHGYTDQNLYSDRDKFQSNVEQLTDEINRSHDVFISHYEKKYGDPFLPPVWMVSEVMSFGLLSKFVSLIDVKASRQAIARPFGLDEKIFCSFLHHLATVRNICAHHGRLWNRKLTVTAKLPTNPPELAASLHQTTDRQIYNTLVLIAHCMSKVAPTSNWKQAVVDLLSQHPQNDLDPMGAPLNWAGLPIWR